MAEVSNPCPQASFDRFDKSAPIRYTAYGLIALGILRLIPTISFTSFQNDFSHYYIGGAMLSAGLNPYTEPLEAYCRSFDVPYDPDIPYAAHPPLILWIFSHLSHFSMPIAYGIWLVLQIACMGGCLELTRRILHYRWKDNLWLIIVAVFLNASCVQSLFLCSQVALMVGLMVYASFSAYLAGRTTLACAMITLASAFKIYPIVLAPWFFLAGFKGSGQRAKGFVAAAVVGLFCLLLPGIHTWHDFVTLGIPALSNNAARWGNYSVQNLLFMLAKTTSTSSLPGVLTADVKLLAGIASLALITTVYFVTIARRLEPREAFSILLVVMTIGGVISWAHYLTTLLLPVALLCSHAMKLDSKGFKVAACAAGVLALTPDLDVWLVLSFESAARIFSHACRLLHFYPLFAAGLVAILILAAAESLRAKQGS